MKRWLTLSEYAEERLSSRSEMASELVKTTKSIENSFMYSTSVS
jgi:hypothetical protein